MMMPMTMIVMIKETLFFFGLASHDSDDIMMAFEPLLQGNITHLYNRDDSLFPRHPQPF